MSANPKRWKAPDTLSDAIDMLQDLRGVVEDLEQQVESISEDASRAEEECESAEARADEAEGALQDEARELACALTLVRQGRSAEAQAAIDGILQRIDGDCKARMSAVVLPQFPGFA